MSGKPLAEGTKPQDIYEAPLVSERNLLAACLERAIRDICNKPDQDGSKDNMNGRYCREAIAWMRSQDKSPFSFRWICHHLDVDAKHIRRFVYELKKEGKRFNFDYNLGS